MSAHGASSLRTEALAALALAAAGVAIHHAAFGPRRGGGVAPEAPSPAEIRADFDAWRARAVAPALPASDVERRLASAEERTAALERAAIASTGGASPSGPARDLPVPSEPGHGYTVEQVETLRTLLDAVDEARHGHAERESARRFLRHVAPGVEAAREDAAIPLMLRYESDITTLYREDPRTAAEVAAFRERVEARRARLAADLTPLLGEEAARKVADALPPSHPLSTTDKKAATGGR